MRQAASARATALDLRIDRTASYCDFRSRGLTHEQIMFVRSNYPRRQTRPAAPAIREAAE